MRILFAEGSSTSSRQFLYCLQDRDRVDILDPNPLCQSRFSRWRSRYRRCPRFAADPLGYLRFLVGRLRAEKYDVLIATHQQAYLLSRVRRELGQLVGLALPQFAALQRMEDKAAFARLLDEAGLPSPQTSIVRTRAELITAATFPCFVKTAFGTAGLGVREIRCRESLEAYADQLSECGEFENGGEIIVQKPAAGELAVVCAVFCRGRLVGHHVAWARRYRVGTLARESFVHPGITEDLTKIGDHVGWHGALFIECFVDRSTGKRQYIEANPRPGELVNARLSGVNLGEQLIRISLGEEVEPLPAGASGVRSHQGYLLGLAAALDGNRRGQILAEVLDSARARGFYRGGTDELVRLHEDVRSVIPALAVVARLTAVPRSAERIVRTTVENYGLPGAAASRIAQLSQDELAACFDP